jgi:hypothetical protein
MMRHPNGPQPDQRGAVTGEPGAAVEAGGLQHCEEVIAGEMVLSWRTSSDFPTLGGPSRRTLWS